MRKKIELLAPAGSLEKIKYAFLYGADAVYFGGQNFSLRANAKNLSINEIREACELAHKLKKKVYVTVNIVFHNEDYPGIEKYLCDLDSVGVAAIIISDLFLIQICKKNKLKMEIHISTQYSTANNEAVKYLKSLGVSRVVLAREMAKDEIKEIIDTTGMEIETFVHGAMCSSYSGRCVLSNYFTNRDANRGGCAQVCRFEFDMYNKNNELIQDKTKFTMSCKDLSLINNLKDMIDIGITSLKVEGRMRSSYYIATVINTYRKAIDDYYNNDLTKEKLDYYNRVLARVANRDNTEQFFNTFPKVKEQYFLGRQEISNQDYLGLVEEYDDKEKIVTIRVKNYFKEGNLVEMFGPNIETFSFIIPKLMNSEGNDIEVANHPEELIKFKLDKKVYQDDILRIKI